MRRPLFFLIALMFAGLCPANGDGSSASIVQKRRISIRTENFARPPYSGATYYIYERDGEVICTKLEVCNKYDNCFSEYWKGAHKEEQDVETGEPFRKTDAVFIPAAKLRKHVCLTKFKLLSK